MDEFQKRLMELDGLGLDEPEEINLDDIKLDDAGYGGVFPVGGARGVVIEDALGSMSTFVDIVFCIDVTQSMSPIIATIKGLALDLYDDLVEKMKEKNNRQSIKTPI